MYNNRLQVVDKDEWLLPVEQNINARHERYVFEKQQLGVNFKSSFKHQEMGFHYDDVQKGWRFSEYLPSATAVYIMGDFNDWNKYSIPLMKNIHGVWSYFFDDRIFFGQIVNGSRYKIIVNGENGEFERIDAYARAIEEDKNTFNYTPYIYSDNFDWKGDVNVKTTPLIIYEAHIGMAQEFGEVGSYDEFTDNILPKIKKAGYTTIQLMGVAEHPYYGSFGYHVSNFFASSFRFGKPEALKRLILTAHQMGIAIIMDIVHAHFVKNFREGINELDGSKGLYSPQDESRYLKHWDSITFNYGSEEVRGFLLSNLRYWMEEFHFDGFRFDGVTSMLYKNHGYQDFLSRNDYFCDNVNEDALLYLTLANDLVHTINPQAITIAEDVSGMPTLCSPISWGGVGFDYRLGMSVPDYWIKTLEKKVDDWDLGALWYELNNRAKGVKTIGYCESHDQAMVGDKTIAFRLMDKHMYFSMNTDSTDVVVTQGVALHKMIRFLTATSSGNGYLNFMGNEFGHPEWIDFPRKGNDFSYSKAHRQWSLAEDKTLRYNLLATFDRAMIELLKKHDVFKDDYSSHASVVQSVHALSYCRSGLIFVFNFNTHSELKDHVIYTPQNGEYELILSSDESCYNGNDVIGTQFFITDKKGEAQVNVSALTVNVYALCE